MAENNKNQYIPFRDSKLTRLLQNDLVGDSLISFICCVSPSENNF